MKKVKSITYRSSDSNGVRIPCIIIQGKFLTDYGFRLGDKVKIEYSSNKIILEAVETKNLKPKCRLKNIDIDIDFSIFMSKVLRELRANGLGYRADDLIKKASRLKTYEDVLVLCNKYVDII